MNYDSEKITGKKKKRRWPGAAAALLCAALVLDSRYRIVTTEYEIRSASVPAGFDGFRIVQVSDLHGMKFGRGNSRLFEKVAKARPDIIAMTGDFVEDPDELAEFEVTVRGLCAIAPVYFISGNHDWASGCMEKMAGILDKYGAQYLRNEYAELISGGERLILAGVEDPNGYAGMKTPEGLVSGIRDTYPEDFILLLAHRNYWMERYPLLDVNLILCGHAHGGIIRLPFIGGLIGTNLNLFSEYENGLYEGSVFDMVVSRGLGDSVPVPSFLNNAHLPVIVLRGI